jgi:hypothetical protein
MALRQFCLHVLHMWKDNDQVDARLGQRPSGCSTTTKWMLALLCPSLPEGLCVSKTIIVMAFLASFLGVAPFRVTQDPMVDARCQTLPLVEATAVGLYSISKAYRPEFDVRGAPERVLVRDRAVPGLHSAVFRRYIIYDICLYMISYILLQSMTS